jgi:predicted hydrocarbon binding protein
MYREYKFENQNEPKYLKNQFLMTLERRRPGYRYYELLVFIPNVVGVLSTITKKLAEEKINILNGMHTQVEDRGIWVSFIEVPESISIEKTMEELSSLGIVSDIKCHQMDRTEKFDKFLFPLSFFDGRIIALTDYMFNSLTTSLIEVLKSGGESILYMQGQTLGESAVNVAKERFKQELTSVEDVLRYIEDAFRAFGWGILAFQSVDPRTKMGSIIVRECMECRRSSKTKCHFIRGVLVGALKKAFENESINLVEVKCMSEGAPYCEFQFV